MHPESSHETLKTAERSGAIVHPTAIVGTGVELNHGVRVGPYSVIRGQVHIGEGTQIEGHVTIGSEFGRVEIGRDNRILSGAIVGGPPQDLKYNAEPTRLVIGDGNTIREFVTINIGTPTGGGVTRIGNGCLLMAYVHVAHDCQIGDNVVIANSTQLAGHVQISDYVRMGGLCGVSQFVRIGDYAFIAGYSAVNKDVLPYTMAQGHFAQMRATNKIGLQRAGFSPDEIRQVVRAVRAVLMGGRTMAEAIRKIEEECSPIEPIQKMLAFLRTSERGVALK